MIVSKVFLIIVVLLHLVNSKLKFSQFNRDYHWFSSKCFIALYNILNIGVFFRFKSHQELTGTFLLCILVEKFLVLKQLIFNKNYGLGTIV